MKKVIVAYIPVIHSGYKQLFLDNKDAETLYIIGNDFLLDEKILEEADYFAEEIRALNPEEMQQVIKGWGVIANVSILDKNNIKTLKGATIVMPDEDISHFIVERYLVGENVIFNSIFLRWDRNNRRKEKKIGPEKIITENEFMNKAFKTAEKSSDWWRKIGAVIVKDEEIIVSWENSYVPSPQQAYSEGDPRDVSHKGEDLDLYLTIHAEAGSIAEAARKGISLDGAEMYVTDFPCPVCAKQIAFAGIKRLYYTNGYAVLDGERILKSKGIEIIKVKKTTD